MLWRLPPTPSHQGRFFFLSKCTSFASSHPTITASRPFRYVVLLLYCLALPLVMGLFSCSHLVSSKSSSVWYSCICLVSRIRPILLSFPTGICFQLRVNNHSPPQNHFRIKDAVIAQEQRTAHFPRNWLGILLDRTRNSLTSRMKRGAAENLNGKKRVTHERKDKYLSVSPSSLWVPSLSFLGTFQAQTFLLSNSLQFKLARLELQTLNDTNPWET